MVYYVAHKYGGDFENLVHAKRIMRELQTNDLDNTYISPLCAFSHLRYSELDFDEEMDLCIDLLSICDALIVASEQSKGVKQEIEFAKLVGMEVIYLEDRFR